MNEGNFQFELRIIFSLGKVAFKFAGPVMRRDGGLPVGRENPIAYPFFSNLR
jgi:hypothetical protein